MLLEDFCNNGDSGVHWIGDHQNEGFGSGDGDACCKIADDTSVDLNRDL